jgi:hypothetical protein
MGAEAASWALLSGIMGLGLAAFFLACAVGCLLIVFHLNQD